MASVGIAGVSPSRVLVVRLGRIGDMVMITPALRAILARHPGAEIDLLTSPEGREVLRGFDARIASVTVHERRGLGESWRRHRLVRTLAGERYDHVYCFETNPSFHALLQRVPGEQHLLAASRERMPFPERCLRLVGIQPAAATWAWLPVSAAANAAACASFEAVGIRGSDFVVGLHLTFSALGKLSFRGREARRRKTWPIGHFARLSALLAEHGRREGFDLRLVTVLLPQFRDLGAELVQRSEGRVTLFADAPDFERYKAMLARMNLFVGPDTGPTHVATALGTPLVALFCGADPGDCGPYTDPERYAVVRAEDTARPELGLAAISPEVVFEACRKFLPPAAPAVRPGETRA